MAKQKKISLTVYDDKLLERFQHYTIAKKKGYKGQSQLIWEVLDRVMLEDGY